VYPDVPSIILTATQVGNSGLVVSPEPPESTGVLWLDSDEPSDIPVPTGGTANQVLAKIDSTNYNTQWITPPNVPVGGTAGQFLRKINSTDYNAGWANIAASEITSGALDHARMPSGSVLQVVQASTTTNVQITSGTSFVDTTLTATITPKFSDSKILILVNQSAFKGSGNSENAYIYRILRGTTVIHELPTQLRTATAMEINTTLSTAYLDSPNTTSARTYKTQFRNAVSANQVQSQNNNQPSVITLMEIAG
jgi:hypothetical protein